MPIKQVLSIAVFLIFLSVALAWPGAELGADLEDKKNIVVIMTDDQAFNDLGVMNKTKNLLRDNGITFSQFVTSYSLCCPSRATYLSGQYAHNHGVLGNPSISNGQGGYDAERNKNKLLPSWLQSAGYRTAHIGKYLNGYGSPAKEVPPGWTDWMGAPGASAYRMYNYQMNFDGELKYFRKKYQTDLYSDLAVRFIQDNQDKPFFLSVAPLAPHTERINGQKIPPRPALRHSKVAVPKYFPPPSFNEKDISDKPLWLQYKEPLGKTEIKRLTGTLYQQRLRSLLAVDDMVARIYEQLEQEGLLSKTYIIFLSDNGYLFGEHRLQTKNWQYQEATRVPLIVSGPGIDYGQTSNTLVGNVDLAPTIADMAGVNPIITQDGKSILPLLRGQVETIRDDFLLESFEGHNSLGGGKDEAYGEATHIGLRTNRYVYVEYFSGDAELYDLQTDPYQLRNLYYDFQYDGLVKDFHKRLEILRNCQGQGCL